MQMVRQCAGSLKRAKPVKACYFWLKLLIDEVLMELKCMSLDEMVS